MRQIRGIVECIGAENRSKIGCGDREFIEERRSGVVIMVERRIKQGRMSCARKGRGGVRKIRSSEIILQQNYCW